MSRRRRTRYSFIVESDDFPWNAPDFSGTRRIDVLAYSRESAISLLEKRGYYNIEEQKNNRSGPKRKLPQAHRIDHLAVRQAIKQLGLQWSVDIKHSSTVGNLNGVHRLDTKTGRPRHNIRIKQYLEPKRAGEVLWHELTHAMQAERAAAEKGMLNETHGATWAWDAHRAAGARPQGVYRNAPIEIEARANEKRNTDLPLAKDM